MSLTELESRALTLPTPQRAALARLLLESLDSPPDSDPEFESAISAEVHRRYLAHLADPHATTHSHEELVAQLGRKLSSQSPR